MMSPSIKRLDTKIQPNRMKNLKVMHVFQFQASRLVGPVAQRAGSLCLMHMGTFFFSIFFKLPLCIITCWRWRNMIWLYYPIPCTAYWKPKINFALYFNRERKKIPFPPISAKNLIPICRSPYSKSKYVIFSCYFFAL